MKNSKSLSFAGKIIAGVTHEINNVLAIINETTGLMEDILSISRDDSIQHIDRLEKSIPKIYEQTKRGVKLTKNLNRFAHGFDIPETDVDLNRVLEQIIFLSNRFARNKVVTMEFKHPDKEYITFTNPVMLQIILHKSMELFWENIPGGGKLDFSIHGSVEGTAITIIYKGNEKVNEEIVSNVLADQEWKELDEMTAGIGGKISFEPSDLSLTIVLTKESRNTS